MTISDGLEKCLKKGKGEEQALAAINFILLMIQLGNGELFLQGLYYTLKENK
jgi:hypothetical protein